MPTWQLTEDVEILNVKFTMSAISSKAVFGNEEVQTHKDDR
jgi:hypothetical protein